jgi:hypothetical protein
VAVDTLLAGPVPATCYGMNGPGIEFRWRRNFPHRSWGLPSLPKKLVTGIFPGSKAARAWHWQLPHLEHRLKKE